MLDIEQQLAEIHGDKRTDGNGKDNSHDDDNQNEHEENGISEETSQTAEGTPNITEKGKYKGTRIHFSTHTCKIKGKWKICL